MNATRLFPSGVVGVVALMASFAPSTKVSGCDSCLPLFIRVMHADSIVVGTTILSECEQIGRVSSIWRSSFRIDKVLKGDRYEPGAVIVVEWSDINNCPDHAWHGRVEPPSIRFLSHWPDGKPSWNGCGGSADEATIETVRRMVAVSLKPQEFVDSDDPTDVDFLIDWIGWNYFAWRGRPDEPLLRPGASRGLDRDAAIRFLMRVAGASGSTPRTDVIRKLAGFRAPEAFDMLVGVLDSEDKAEPSNGESVWLDKKIDAIRGLGALHDERAVPILLAHLQADCRREKAKAEVAEAERCKPPARQDCSHHWLVPVYRRVRQLFDFKSRPDYSHERLVGSYLSALGEIGDPRAVDEVLVQLKGVAAQEAARALGDIGDRRAVEPLLAKVWDHKWAVEPLSRFSDPRIAEKARRRAYDHPNAPFFLALQGELADRDFMHRLIRQGRKEGALWAAAARDHSAVGLLRESLHHVPLAASEVSFALARLRDFRTIEAIVSGSALPPEHKWSLYAPLVLGLSDERFRSERTPTRAEYWTGVAEKLRDVADRENWTDPQRDLAGELMATVIDQWQPRDPLERSEPDWLPPDALPDMPDPIWSKDAAGYLESNGDRIRAVLSNGTVTDKQRIIKGLQMAALNLYERGYVTRFLGHELAVDLLCEPSYFVGGAVWLEVRTGQLELQPEDFARLVDAGDYLRIREMLEYMAKHPQVEFRPIIAEVFRRGWHLHEPAMFEAIEKNHVTECVEPLRSYLEGQHVELRQRAKVALKRLGATSVERP